MKWFKFYGQDYLSDPKILALSGSERSCWITLLAYGSVDDNGMITFLDEQTLMAQSGISPMNEEWESTLGVLEKLKNLKMITVDNGVITILNWKKRQETSLTGYERVRRYRKKHKNDNAVITSDKIRIDKNRIDKKIKMPDGIVLQTGDKYKPDFKRPIKKRVILSEKQKAFIKRMKSVDYFHKRGVELGYEYLKEEDDQANRKFQGLARAFEKRYPENWQKVIDWWFENDNAWSDYHPSQFFSINTWMKFDNKLNSVKNPDAGILRE